MEIKVKKRDGSIEDYNPDKILRVVKAAGLEDDQAQTLVNNVNSKIQEKGKNEITSVQIRDLIIVEIQKIDKEVAQKFIWYEKQRDKNFGLE